MAEKDYQVVRTSPHIYTDQLGGVINGYLVTVYLPQFDETHQVRVSSLKTDAAVKEIDELLKWRVALSEL